MRTAVAVAVLTMVLAPAASAQTVPDVRPPDAYLSSSSGEARGEVQMFCWSEPDGSGGTIGVCGDRFDDIDPDQSLVVGQGELLTLRFDPPFRPTSVRVSRVERSTGPPIQTFEIPADNPTQFRADFPPGTHILRVFTRWPQGDAIYVFEVTVLAGQPPSGALPPEVLDAIARVVDAARALVAVGGRIDGHLSDLLASAAALLAALEDLVP